MSEDDQELNSSSTLFSRYRSPTFTKNEIETLVNLVDKYKFIVLNKSPSTTACYAKEIIWRKITKAYNSHNFNHVRSVDCLRIKWENLKKTTRKLSKNVLDIKRSEHSEAINQILRMIHDAENSTCEVEMPKEIVEEIKDGDSEENKGTSRSNRSIKFAPHECRLLLKCVRAEKKVIFCKDTSAKAIKLKNKAWLRVTEAYNQQSPQKRTTKVLRTKFCNMKKISSRIRRHGYLDKINKKHFKLEEECNSDKIKAEPVYEIINDQIQNDDEHSNDDMDYNEIPNNVNENSVDMAPDPLSTVLNSDSGMESIRNMESYNMLDNKEILELKKELLNYELETAKLKRKKIEEEIQEEAIAREMRATERALRLRAARLELVAAEMKLPVNHPALYYMQQEAPAQACLNQHTS
ncbi:uncharacterized protein LOC131848189 [Achroia grisella]|uniref:uncharacterized protein LOC131848189 n=1 Tax=Achroia grisella TaxID=688607 RepID=UPI0027D31FC5|nr:uncharacterized protein LOC131848189 [Achroia grisella]